MFDAIEKSYKRDAAEQRYNKIYWPLAVILCLVAIIFSYTTSLNIFLIVGVLALVLLAIVVLFFYLDIKKLGQSHAKLRDTNGVIATLRAYFAVNDEARLDNLIKSLRQLNIRTSDDVKVMIEYFEHKLPSPAKPSLFSGTLSLILSIGTLVIVAYDDSINTINVSRLVSVLVPTISVAIIILLPFLLAQIVISVMNSIRRKKDTALVEDLIYIYINFATLEKRLK